MTGKGRVRAGKSPAVGIPVPGPLPAGGLRSRLRGGFRFRFSEGSGGRRIRLWLFRNGHPAFFIFGGAYLGDARLAFFLFCAGIIVTGPLLHACRVGIITRSSIRTGVIAGRSWHGGVVRLGGSAGPGARASGPSGTGRAVRIVGSGGFGGLCGSFRSPLPVIHDRIVIDRLHSRFGILHGRIVQVAHLYAPVGKGVSPEPKGIGLALLVDYGHNRRVARQTQLRDRIGILEPAGKREHVPRRIHNLAPSPHLHVLGEPVVIQRIAPALLVLRHNMHILPEEELLGGPVEPSVIRRKHILMLPGVGPKPEIGRVLIRMVLQARSLYEHRIGEHIDVVHEREGLQLGIILPEPGLDDLAVLVPHRRPVLEDGDTVPGIVIQILRTEDILVLVLQLDQRPAELREVFIDYILKRLALQGSPVLDYLDMAVCENDIGLDIPEGRVAEEVGIVVEELRRSYDLSEILAVLLNEARGFGLKQHYD